MQLIIEKVQQSKGVLMSNGEEPIKKKRGRPRLSDEEKARRAKERAEQRKTGGEEKTKKRKSKKAEKVEEQPKREPEVEKAPRKRRKYFQIFEQPVIPTSGGNRRRYMFVMEEDVRHSLGTAVAKLKYEFVPASYIMNELAKMFIAGNVKVPINEEDLDKWLKGQFETDEIPESIDNIEEENIEEDGE